MSGLGYIDPRTVDLEGLASDYDGADDATLEGLGGFDEDAMLDQQVNGILAQNPDWEGVEGVGFLKKILKNNKNSLLKVGGAVLTTYTGGAAAPLIAAAVGAATAKKPGSAPAPAPVAIVQQQPGPVAPPPPPPAPAEDKLKKYAPWAIGGGILLIGVVALSRRK